MQICHPTSFQMRISLFTGISEFCSTLKIEFCSHIFLRNVCYSFFSYGKQYIIKWEKFFFLCILFLNQEFTYMSGFTYKSGFFLFYTTKNYYWKWKLLCVSDSLGPHGWTIHSWNSPGQNTGVGSPSSL